MKRLFVYGTLKRGFRAAEYLKEAQFIGIAKTREAVWKMTAYHPNEFPYPAVQEGGDAYISGEIYDVPDELWPILDDYEEIDLGRYKRQMIALDQNRTADIYIDIDKISKPIPDHPSIYFDDETKTYTWR